METQTENLPSTALAVSSVALLMDSASMDRLERIADIMAVGKTTVPQHLRGNKGDCFAVVMQSMTWGMNPFAVAQKTHLVNGTLGYEGQLVAAVINNSKVVADRFHFEWFGPWEKVIGKFAIKRGEKGEYRVPGWVMADEEGCGIRVSATLKGETQPRVLELLLSQARVRNSTLWADDPKQQLAYLAQKKWARLYAPDVILGVYSPDEFEGPSEINMGAADVVGSPAPAPAPATGRPELPPYDPAKFDHNLKGAWKKRVNDGGNPEDLIAMLQTRNTLTAEQIKAIRNLAVTDVPATEVPADPPAAAPAEPADPAADDNGWSDFKNGN